MKLRYFTQCPILKSREGAEERWGTSRLEIAELTYFLGTAVLTDIVLAWIK